jgi:hypothetical protein
MIAWSRASFLMLSIARPRTIALLAGLLIAGYFFYQARFSLRAEFTHDDLMNCERGFFSPLGTLAGDIVLFFRPSFVTRPFGALVYKAAFGVSGFNLFPLRVALLAVMGLNVFLLYCFVRRLTQSREMAILSALLSSYHGGMWGFFYNTGQLYDIFCFFFYFLALVYYLRVRQAGRLLRVHELVLFGALYALALDSKELAVSLPIMIAAYELLFNPPPFGAVAVFRWASRDLIPVWVTGAMTVAFVRFRVTPPGGLSSVEAYRIAISPVAYLQQTGHYLDDLFYRQAFFNPPRTLAVVLILLLVAVMAKSRKLALCWLLFFAGILPMAFIPPRGLPAAWIPLAGLFAYAAVAAVGCRDAVLRLAGRVSWKPAGQLALFALVAWFMLAVHHGNGGMYDAMRIEYNSIASVRIALNELCPAMPKGSRILFVTDPLNGTYSTVFLVELLYRDRSLHIDQLFRLDNAPNAAELAKYNYVFDFVDRKLVRLDPARYAKEHAGG